MGLDNYIYLFQISIHFNPPVNTMEGEQQKLNS